MKLRPANQVTLDDVLRLVLPLSTIVIGGRMTGRLASWVSILTEQDHVERQVQAGDLVILPASLQVQLEDSVLAECVEQLANLPTVALLVFEPVPEHVERAAEDRDFPILVVTGDTNLRDVHQGIAALLVDRQKQISERGMQLYRRLTEMSREEQGLEAMTQVMSKLTGKIVAVQDKRLEIQAIAFPEQSPVDEETVRAVLARPENLPPVLRDRKAAATTQQSHWQQLLPFSKVKMARLISPIISGDRARGYVSVVGAPDALDLLDTLASEHGAAACALEMAKAKAISETKKALRGDFLEGLLAGTLPVTEIDRLSGRLDHRTSRPHAILTFAWSGPNQPSLRRLETPLNRLLSSHNRQALTHLYGNDHVCVFQALEVKDDDLSTAYELARRLRDHLRAEFPKATLICGISGPAETLSDWPDVHRQAVQAMELGRRLGSDHAIDFNRLGVYQLLTQLENHSDVQKFCNEVIGPLARYDQKHGSNFVETLAAFFNHHGNISQTAEALFIHRNTLLYRLERIQELTGQDLGQADMRLSLHLALVLWQLRPD